MRPTLKVRVKSANWRLSWCFAVAGWDVTKCCLAALVGRHVPELRWTKTVARPPVGAVVTVKLFPLEGEHYFHWCTVGESYQANVHVCFRPDPAEGFTVENRYFRIEGRGVRELVIPDAGREWATSGLTYQQRRCRNLIAAWGLLPHRPELPARA
jgi:hypothetical protein